MMTDIVIVTLIAVLMVFAVRYIIRHKSITGCSSCRGDCNMCGKCRKK